MPQNRQSSGSIAENTIAVRSLALDYPSGFRLDYHSHEWHQLIYASRGVLTVYTQTGAWVIPCNRGVWVPAQVQHSLEMSGSVALRTLYFQKYHHAPFETCQAVNISPLMRELILHVIEMGYLLATDAAHARLVVVLVDLIQKLDILPLQLSIPKDRRALRLAKHFQNHPDDTRSLAHLSTQTGASQRTLERLFLSETGMTCGRWRQQCRLLAAFSRLAQGDSVTEVSLAMGYQNTSAFIAIFKTVFGITPGKYFHNQKSSSII